MSFPDVGGDAGFGTRKTAELGEDRRDEPQDMQNGRRAFAQGGLGSEVVVGFEKLHTTRVGTLFDENTEAMPSGEEAPGSGNVRYQGTSGISL
jgi:hypothetical protein